MTAPAPRPALSLFDAVMIITGIVIGAGIFSAPPLVAHHAGGPGWMWIAWLLGGALSLAGALCYAELATAFPHAGGDYHFLTRAYGRDASFFFAWARVSVITTGSVALLAFVFGDYMSRILPLGPHSPALYAALTVLALTAIHVAGLRQSARAQNLLTIAALAGLLLLALAAATLLARGALPPHAGAPAAAAAGSVPPHFGLAMVFVLLCYGGWNEAAYLSAEVLGGRRAILRALLIALLLITSVYLLVVGALVGGLGFQGLEASRAAGADLMQAAFGPAGTTLIGACVAAATLTSAHGTLLVGARTWYAVGQDWPVLAVLGRWRADRDAPVIAFLVQGGTALALIALGAVERSGFETMVEFTAPVFWFFFLLTGCALFALRFREPRVSRPFPVPGYPIVPLVFVASCAWLLYASLAYARSRRAVHVALYLVAAGLPPWLVARRSRARDTRPR